METKLRTMIIEYMARHDINQVEMARRLEVQQGTLSNWLSGGHGITRKNASRIRFVCDECGCLRPRNSRLFAGIRDLIDKELDILSEQDLIKIYSIIVQLREEKKCTGAAEGDSPAVSAG